jgi:glucose 1-dehydrogenase
MGFLEGRVAIVSGAGSGIGQNIAIRLGREGVRVVVDYIGSDEGARQTVSTITEAGGTACSFQADITQLDEIQALMEKAWAEYGGCDILVNNAGLEKKAAFWDVTEDDYDKVLDVNLKGPFFLTQAFVCRLRDANKPGRIINISSVHEDMAFPGFATYCMSKGGLRMMMRDLCVELGPLGITVNNIAPGAIMTPINMNLMDDEVKMDALRKNIPLGYMGKVEDVSGLVAYLASDEAAYVTGATFTIDGGLSRSYHEQ